MSAKPPKPNGRGRPKKTAPEKQSLRIASGYTPEEFDGIEAARRQLSFRIGYDIPLGTFQRKMFLTALGLMPLAGVE